MQTMSSINSVRNTYFGITTLVSHVVNSDSMRGHSIIILYSHSIPVIYTVHTNV